MENLNNVANLPHKCGNWSERPARDPSDNVKNIVIAEAERQDELRMAESRRQDSLRESDTRANAAAIAHQKEINDLRAEHAISDSNKEANRIDAILAADAIARNTAADRSGDALQALAATTATNAENLRNALVNTAQTIAQQTAAQQAANAKLMADSFSEITVRIGKLEQAYSEDRGKQAYVDPMMTSMLGEIKKLSEFRSNNNGESRGSDKTWAMIIGGVSLIGGLIVLAPLLERGRDSTPSVQQPQPITINVPPAASVPIPAPLAKP